MDLPRPTLPVVPVLALLAAMLLVAVAFVRGVPHTATAHAAGAGAMPLPSLEADAPVMRCSVVPTPGRPRAVRCTTAAR